MDFVSRKPSPAVRRPVKDGGRSIGGILGAATLVVTLAALAVSAYLDAPSMSEGDRGAPEIHWGGR